jgi:protein-disulfide isomerase
MIKPFLSALAATFVMSASYVTPSIASDNNFSATQTKQIEQIVHNYLINNPTVIVEALQDMQKKETKQYADGVKAQLPKNTKEVFKTKAPGRETIGSDKPDIIIADFFSYQCPNCRVIAPTVDKLINSQKNIQLILIGWTFEGKDDLYAAKVDLAAQKQGKYYDLYKALMNQPDVLTKDLIDKIAKATGLDMDKLQKDMSDSNIDKGLAENFKLAQDLKLIGTPTFIITNSSFSKFSVLLGRVSEQELQKAIDEVR